MPKINVTVSEKLLQTLRELADDEGESLSAIASKCIEFGLLPFLEPRTKMQAYQKFKRDVQERENKKNGEKTTND